MVGYSDWIIKSQIGGQSQGGQLPLKLVFVFFSKKKKKRKVVWRDGSYIKFKRHSQLSAGNL